MGKALQKYKIPRQKVVIMTKCFRVLCDPENYKHDSTVTMHHEAADRSKDYVNQWGTYIEEWLPPHEQIPPA